MSRFTEATYELTGESKRGRPLVTLTSPLVYEINYLGSGWKIEAEKGFRTDLVSMPAFAFKIPWLCSIAHSMARSAIVHDKLRNDTRHPKLFGDYIFFQAMEVEKVNAVCRVLAFLIVLLNFRRD